MRIDDKLNKMHTIEHESKSLGQIHDIIDKKLKDFDLNIKKSKIMIFWIIAKL